ncbi:MAG: LytTR family DNA-binding domain-containing protein [Gammaproteobacteria bacterium]|nr:LytTR family DNA-binding domain-containing protein [Gammaproteobacteria bacterium]
MNPRAIIAEDEPQLAQDLAARLNRLWPELEVLAVCHDGREAARRIAAERPEVAFLDIRMPGLTGLEVAEQLPEGCRLVFVTAYDHYAVEAFDRAAVDYLLKPLSDKRLSQTVARLREHRHTDTEQLRALLREMGDAAAEPQHLQWIRAQVGERVKLVPVDEVLYFAAEDKYTNVVTADGIYLIRKPIKALEAELDPERFWRIHRGTIVNARAIDSVSRDFRGRLNVSLRGSEAVLTASRGYAERFRQM